MDVKDIKTNETMRFFYYILFLESENNFDSTDYIAVDFFVNCINKYKCFVFIFWVKFKKINLILDKFSY